MLEKVQEDRANKLKAVSDLGFDPYGCRYDGAEAVRDLHTRFEQWERDNGGVEEAKKVETRLRGKAAGRVMLYRDMGKMIFAHVRDESHPVGIQVALRKPKGDVFTVGALNEQKEFQLAKLLDLGDIIGVEGPMERTKTGEVTIWAESLTMLCKSLNPMPEKWHGLTDVETRYRQRYLDLMTNPESMVTFQKRVSILETFRELLKNRGFSEVETPTLQAIYGGAAARPFLTHHNALDIDLFMRISPELYLKRLLVGGMQKVFEIGRNFRNEGIDTRHNPEFTMMELYQAYADYEVMMEITEELVSSASQKINGSTVAPYGERTIDYTRPWPRRKYADLIKEYAGVDWKDDAAVRAKARSLGLNEANKDLAVVVNDIFELVCEPEMAKSNQPTFVIDYPAAICPLTRRKADDPTVALRFECFVAGMEIANAYTELNDPAIQEENFAQQLRGEAEGETMRVMDEDFVAALRHGMPPAGGLGIGIDRVVMLLTNRQSIRDVVLFPLLRPLA